MPSVHVPVFDSHVSDRQMEVEVMVGLSIWMNSPDIKKGLLMSTTPEGLYRNFKTCSIFQVCIVA